jgi:hypothetical protein
MLSNSESALDARARHAAHKAGLAAKKTRWRANSVDNHGGFQVFDPNTNTIVNGVRFDLSAEEVIAYCEEERAQRISKRYA